MAVNHKETWDSRKFTFGAQGGGMTWRATVWGSDDAAEVYAYLVTNTGTTLDGFIRQDFQANPLGGGVWDATVEYGTSGMAGGGDATGTTPTQPTPPDTQNDPLTSGYSFSVSFPSRHISQSLATISSTGRGANVPKDFKGAINVNKDGDVAGVEIPPTPVMTWQRTVARASVSCAYLRTLAALCATTNVAQFYHFAAGEVCYLGADGQFTEGEGWSITHKFGVNANETDIPICDGLTVDAKNGFQYLWVAYEEIQDGGVTVQVPHSAYVEQVLEESDFTEIGIGGLV